MAKVRCAPTPNKVRFKDENQAKSALMRIKTTLGVQRAKVPDHWYFCDPFDGGCNGYHLTSQERS